ncbi:hypothetical protein JAB5_48970 [Janthinobacterium sp. HH103]|uniref:hypothetical protein n=1 Tax=unclassified Janthinobacterium TaxID=2610881 RepID=UPI000893BB20|nr:MULTISPECIES: hypothetical protein [unclassified Janthinobacterium]OEZ68019.1 hypothetical protein JAB2_20220 [Janthinobacterium sp. HH100]OEZ68479.1 hypothetical protein JAB5_48970 [Janthinobacterium sp. HH103]QOU75824.1 hypothetical protein JAB4_053120 [Janthinobacterium sp. HH102]
MTLQASHPDYQRYSMASLQQALSGADGADAARRQRIEAEIAQRQQDDHAAEQRQWAARPQDKPLDPATAALKEAAGPFLRSAGYVLLFAWVVLRVAGLLETLQTGSRTYVFGNLGLLIFGACLVRGKLRAAVWLRWLAIFWIVPAVLAIDFLFLQPMSLTVMQFKLAPGYRIWSVLEAVLSLWVIHYLYRQLGMPAVMAACDARGYKRRDMRIPAICGLILGMAGVAFQLHASHGDTATQARAIVAQRYGSGYQYHVNGVGNAVTPQGRFHTAQVLVWDDKGIMSVPVQWPQ